MRSLVPKWRGRHGESKPMWSAEEAGLTAATLPSITITLGKQCYMLNCQWLPLNSERHIPYTVMILYTYYRTPSKQKPSQLHKYFRKEK
jgi:hypothetical protein